MKHVYDIASAQLTQASVVTIGVFDGVHAGHQHLVRQLVQEAHATGRQAVVVTFFPHPDVILKRLAGRYYLTMPEQKAAQLLKLGVDLVVTHPFDEQVRVMRAASFVELLLRHLRMQALWVGSDFALGYRREGDVAFLRDQGAQRGFVVHETDLLHREGHRISSTAIRQALQAGDVEAARAGLGRGYSVIGEVVRGEGRGRQIGFPTANVAVSEQQVIPVNGVYAGWAWVDGERYSAVTNVGVRPTFNGAGITVEAHLLDFQQDIYGQTLEVSFETLLRPEQRFNGIQELIAQIGLDVQAGRLALSRLESGG